MRIDSVWGKKEEKMVYIHISDGDSFYIDHVP